MFKNGGLLFCAAKATKTVHFFGNFGRHWLVFINIFNFLRNFLDATFCRRIGDDDDDDDELYSCVDVFS